MTFRSKGLSGKCNLQKMHLKHEFLLLFLLIPIFDVCSGTYTRTSFRNSAHVSNLINDSVIQLDIERYETVKLFGDQFPGITEEDTTFYPDVFVSGDTFSFFFVDSVINRINRVDIRPDGYHYEPVSRIFRRVHSPSYCYLHSDNADNNFMLTYINNPGTVKRVLNVFTETDSSSIDSTTTGWLYSSQCHMENDTFLVTYSIGIKKLLLTKVYARGNNIQIIKTVTVTQSDTLGNAMNCSVGYDGNGTILVSWMKGKPVNEDKYIYYKFYDRDLNELSNGMISIIASNQEQYFYDETAIVSYGTDKFALVFWNSSGIWMSRISSLNSAEDNTGIIVNKEGAGFCAAASNNKHLMIVYKSSIDDKADIMGLRYSITNNNPGTPETFKISNQKEYTANSFSTAINCAIDSSGNFGVTWRGENNVKGAILANRGVRYKSGYWISPVESLSIHESDSVLFYPAEYEVTSLESWNLESSIRVGKTVQECSTSSWFSLSDESVLNSNRTTNSYFQYKIEINRNSTDDADSISTPVINSIDIDYNIKPVLTEPDSIGFGQITKKDISFKDTITVLSRKDSVILYTAIRDLDSDVNFNVRASYPVYNNSVYQEINHLYPVTLYCSDIEKSDTTVACSILVTDNNGWESVPVELNIQTRNSLPLLDAKAVIRSDNGNRDTVKLLEKNVFNIQETDTVQFLYSVSDTNDYDRVRGYLASELNKGSIVDSTDSPGVKKTYTIAADTVEFTDTVRLTFSAVDPDTTVYFPVKFTINHFPVVESVTVGSDTVCESDTVRVTLQTGTKINISVFDSDCEFWDTLTYIISTRAQSDTLVSDSAGISYQFVARRDDSLVMINIHDKYSKKDSIRFYIKYPWLETDTSVNPQNAEAKRYLKSSPSLVIGSGQADTVVVPYLNNGNDTLHILSIGFIHNSSHWLKAAFMQDSKRTVFTSENADQFKSQTVLPDSVIEAEIIMFPNNLTGDSVICDTILIYTSDPVHPVDSIFVQLEYNDLPTIIDVRPYFIPDVPFTTLAKKKQKTELRFPPHASIHLSFSEPMDSLSAVNGIYVYSIYDSSVNSIAEPIDLYHEWTQNGTVLTILPLYKQKSLYFGYRPPGGLFIPTDSIALVLTNKITDRAQTPNGPNRLDIMETFERISEEVDTTLRMKIDSVTFSLVSVSPLPDDTNVSVKPEIRLQFTSEVYARSVDTSLVNNRSLIVCSEYNGGNQLHFDKISIEDNNVTFSIAKTLFYRDSLWCRYRASGATNLSGFPSDNDEDGIPSSLYDSTSVRDDCFWGYRVKPVRLISVSPSNGTVVDSVTQPVILTFSEPLSESVFSTDTSSDNKSFQFSSIYSIGFSSFKSFEFSSDSTVITVNPTYKNFSDDSIYCKFNGFSSNYRYSRTENYPEKGNGFEQYEWKYFTGKIGFYTFPNPYKPGKDPRHCRDNGPCGIWFKNLHSLKEKNNDVEVKIYSMSGYPVYETAKAGVRIHFETGKGGSPPHWLWNTRNQKNEPVGSGLYFYVISDIKGSVLKKGKLIIVR